MDVKFNNWGKIISAVEENLPAITSDSEVSYFMQYVNYFLSVLLAGKNTAACISFQKGPDVLNLYVILWFLFVESA